MVESSVTVVLNVNQCSTVIIVVHWWLGH